jgi:hypothetical protein
MSSRRIVETLNRTRRMRSVMAFGPLEKFFAPVGTILVLTGLVGAVLIFFFLLFDVSGDFLERLYGAFASTALAFIIGGAALVWLGK